MSFSILKMLFILMVFLGGLYFYICYTNNPKMLEGLTTMNGEMRCPNLLIQKGIKYYLYNYNDASVINVHAKMSVKTYFELKTFNIDSILNKIELDASIDLQKIFTSLKEKYKAQPINDIDGLKIEFGNDWVHLRPSNTEPIIRIYSESSNDTTAENIARKIMIDIHEASKA